MAPIDYEYVWPEHSRFKPPPPRVGYAAKLEAARRAAEEAAQAEAEAELVCPDTTKAGNPCKAKQTDTGYCVGHSKARGLL